MLRRWLLACAFVATVLVAALSHDAVVWAQGYGGVGFPRGGGPARGLLDALYCQLASPCVLTGDNASGTGTLRIRPSDEDTQLVLCEAGNNASPEVCSAWSHANFSTTETYGVIGLNAYLNTSTAASRYNTSFGASYTQYRAQNSNASTGQYRIGMNTSGTAVSMDYCFLDSGGTTATCTFPSTTTLDSQKAITNSGSATCRGLWAGSLCIADDLMMQYGSGDTVYRMQSTSASGLVYFQALNSSDGAAGSFGYGNASYTDADFAGHFWYLTNSATTPLRLGNTANATATQPIVKVTDDTVASGTVEGQNHLVVYGAGAVAYPNTQTLTCADNGAGTNQTANLDPQSHTITILNNDATGCDVTMQETSAQLGAVAVICVDPASTATNVNLADVANVFNGAAPALSQGDCITIRYFDAANDLWLQTGASNN